MSEKTAYLKYHKLRTRDDKATPYRVASIVLNRPKQANAFGGEMLVTIHQLLGEVQNDKSLRMLLFQGSGENFSAGADIAWLKDAVVSGSHEENVAEANKLTEMFETLSNLAVPTMCVVRGAAYGGGVGIVACCDFTVASESAKFCLNEARIGLLPAVVLPYLNRKTVCGQLRRHILGGRVFQANDAKDFGLVQVQAQRGELEQVVRQEINQILEASPEAQASYKRLQKHLSNHSYQQGPYTAAAIAIARASDFGQAGLSAFLEKKPAPWVCKLDESEAILVD